MSPKTAGAGFFILGISISKNLWYNKLKQIFSAEPCRRAEGGGPVPVKKDVIISIKGLQQDPEGESDTITLVTAGRYYRKNDHYYISYEESELTGLQGTRTTLRVSPDTVRVIRTGECPSELLFETGKRNLSLYHTEYGDLSVVISTRSIRSTLTDDGGELNVSYAVEIGSSPVGVNQLSWNIQNAEEKGAVYQ